MEKRIYTKHKMTGSKLHEVWKEMLRRCKDKNIKSISYKKSHIQVCQQWRNAKIFIDWALSNGYKEGLQIDRIENSKGYSKENCRWVTPRQNSNNKSNTVYIEYKNIRKPLQYWGDELKINAHTLSTRLKRGWTIERAFTTKTK